MPNEDQPNIRDRDGNTIECSTKGGNYVSECLACHNRVVIHCDKCGVQISGCNCTIRVRLGKELRN